MGPRLRLRVRGGGLEQKPGRPSKLRQEREQAGAEVDKVVQPVPLEGLKTQYKQDRRLIEEGEGTGPPTTQTDDVPEAPIRVCETSDVTVALETSTCSDGGVVDMSPAEIGKACEHSPERVRAAKLLLETASDKLSRTCKTSGCFSPPR